jgi:hypothetical protein
MASLKASVAERGERVTTVSNHGGIGLGYLVDGVVYKSGGNGWYYPAAEGFGGLKTFYRDGGADYPKAVNSLNLPLAYRL